MNTKKIVVLFTLLFSFFSINAQKNEGLFAELTTSKGKILLQLEFEKTPVTVANFVSLAEGKNAFVSEQYKGKLYYDGLKFHRVIADFMIQGGDPLGTGGGDPGYKFEDEIVSDLKHDNTGILSMANAGPATNGSQFFITHKATPWLDGKHTVFGHVIEGQEVVNSIAQNDVIEKVTIIRKGKLAKKFKAEKVFENYMKEKEEKDKIEAEKRKALEAKFAQTIADKKAFFEAKSKEAITLPSGLKYAVIQKGTGVKPAEGTQVFIHYAGYFEDGRLFDSSYEDISRANGKFDQNRANANGYAPFPFQYGNKSGLIPGFLEGVNSMSLGDKVILFIPSELGYGKTGAGGGIIPPNTNLIFEVELLESQQ
ncbi:peptidylprolyl isomerase [Flavobacterium sp. TP390]|uniref:peptidylprolyl isomerase n=1 Tax=Flavobacterium profundi TaxID=1774945 RepID=A0A6I4IUH7_9FLAO|nr:peptidylprolyl isomerase [Flavobacterium profundi]MVO10338.1 peptidylprolyl isomerase [Flavobacterium profundi]